MNIICDKQALIDAVGNVQRAVSGKSTLPALEGILLRAAGSSLFLAGFDLDLGITTTTPMSASREKLCSPPSCSVKSCASCRGIE